MTLAAQDQELHVLHDADARGPGHSHERGPSPADVFQSVLSIRSHVEEPEVSRFVRDALREIRAHIGEHHVEVQGPPFFICRPASPSGVDVEVGWPVRQAAGTGRIHCGALPPSLV